MLVLIIGLLLFLGAHSFSMARNTRAKVIGWKSETYYKLSFTAKSIIGLSLIIWGFHRYRVNAWQQIWFPPNWLHLIVFLLMWCAFICLACMNPAPSRIRGWLRHPMLASVKFWALAHLLANGDLGGIILFGSFLAWAVADRISVKKRGDFGAPRIAHFTKADAYALGVGTAAYFLMIFLHPYLIGCRSQASRRVSGYR